MISTNILIPMLNFILIYLYKFFINKLFVRSKKQVINNIKSILSFILTLFVIIILFLTSNHITILILNYLMILVLIKYTLKENDECLNIKKNKIYREFDKFMYSILNIKIYFWANNRILSFFNGFKKDGAFMHAMWILPFTIAFKFLLIWGGKYLLAMAISIFLMIFSIYFVEHKYLKNRFMNSKLGVKIREKKYRCELIIFDVISITVILNIALLMSGLINTLIKATEIILFVCQDSFKGIIGVILGFVGIMGITAGIPCIIFLIVKYRYKKI